MKIIIIKLGAKGDVVRTLPILPAIKQKYPDSEIYWVTKQNISGVFEGNPYITKLLTIPCKITEKFDILYNFDIDEQASSLALEIKADKKFGFYLKDDFASAFNLKAEYYLNTLFDDDLKRNNKKTYQQMMFDAAELEWKKQHCPIYLNAQDKRYAQDFLNKNKINKDKILGIHMGAGPRWPSKAWHHDNLKEFIIKAKNKGFEIILFGGPDEIKQQEALVFELKKEKIQIFQNNSNNSDKEFAALIGLCKIIVCSDSFALHVSLALKKKTIALFFVTSPDEIEGYGMLVKIISPMLYDFFPEKMNEYNEKLVKSISPDQVLKAIDGEK